MPPADNSQHTMQDPRGQYVGPPFDTPTQPEPGLTAEMTPKPDHGEQSYRGSGRLRGRKALVTGGDSGIGRAVAIAFAREGADVAITYLPQEDEDAQEVIAHIKDAGQKAVALPGDISDEAFCREVIEQAVEQLGGLDILANVAGKQIAHEGIEDISTEDFDAHFKVNVYALFWLCKAALPHMPAGASIINTASIQAYQPSPALLAYAPTKSAIVAFTKALAKSVIAQGIRVNAVAPGPIWTPLQPNHGQPPGKIAKFGENTPMGRPGQPAEVAPPMYFLPPKNQATSRPRYSA
jgi:NAD(P)-dependent dehydrogenase (short-subunit alcohol dehydrogenase family)